MRFDEGFRFLGVPIPDELGYVLGEILDTSWIARIVWAVVGMTVGLFVILFGIYIAYS